ncbi:MAG: hypothetical protein JWP57_237 [Spirosoma sp.]|nr:hypothetical protein [Spirosoma sp.]
MDLTNPTTSDLQYLAFLNSHTLNELNAKPIWTDEDVETLLLANHQWDETISWWCVPVEALSSLAFDSRTPDGQALLLQRMVQFAKANNLSSINPNSGFTL